MKITSLASATTLALAMTLGACSTTPPTTAAAVNRPDPTILLVPVQITDPALQSGCWAQFYSQRNFQGDMVTLVGPAEAQSLDEGTAQAFKREIDSLSVGPKATLQVYEHAMFKDRVVSFPVNSREGGWSASWSSVDALKL